MKNQNLRRKKLLKKRRITNDAKRKRNAKKNAPKIVKEFRKPVYDFTGEVDKKGNLKLDERGAPLVKKVGEKIVRRKKSKFTYADSKSKKFKPRKEAKK